MNKEWAESFKLFQNKLKKSSFNDGINELIELRKTLMDEMLSWRDVLPDDDYSKMPYINADGYHNKTVAYSIWHIIRIEDIVVNTLINNKEEILFEGDYYKKINSPIITTGNELVKEEIGAFSAKLDIDMLYDYANNVMLSTNKWLNSISYSDLKRSFGEIDKQRIIDKKVVSNSELAFWLIEYWTGKDVAVLIKMPLSRHWIMHIEAANRIIKKLNV